MKVIYKKAICQQIYQAVEKARRENIQIEKILLSDIEMIQFGREMMYTNSTMEPLAGGPILFAGVHVEQE